MAPGAAEEGDHAGHIRICGEASHTVRVFNIRTFEDIVIDRQPANDGSKDAETWNFFQNLVLSPCSANTSNFDNLNLPHLSLDYENIFTCPAGKYYLCK